MSHAARRAKKICFPKTADYHIITLFFELQISSHKSDFQSNLQSPDSLIMLLNKIHKSPTARLFCFQKSAKLNRQTVRNRTEKAVSSQIVLRTKLKKGSNFEKVMRFEEGPKSVVRVRKDPRDKMILLIGGEESHYVGMCEWSLDDPQVYEMFEKAQKVFGFNLMDMCLNGPLPELRKTKHLLPCVFMANMTGENRTNCVSFLFLTALPTHSLSFRS